MSENIYRQKSVEKINSPEKLNDYIRISSPGTWIVICAVALILIGMFIWGIFGRIEVNNEDGSTQFVAPITFITN